MGQRTQLVIEVNEQKVGYYYNQWGLAKMQLFDVIRFLTTYQEASLFKFPEQLYKATLIGKRKGKESVKEVIKWLNEQDNNDGGIYLKVNMNEYHQIESGSLYIFNDPECEGVNEVNRVISFDEYVKYYPEYFDQNFIDTFLGMLKFYNVELRNA